jgi:hypothetical protein
MTAEPTDSVIAAKMAMMVIATINSIIEKAGRR